MSLRKAGKQDSRPWRLEQLQSGFEEFFKQHGKYPTAHEIDAFEFLPSTRSIERSFGGLRAVRTQLKLTDFADFRSGVHGATRATHVSERGHSLENDVYRLLCDQFDTRLVHREYFFDPSARTRADFFVYDANGNFCVDVFYASTIKSLAGCINAKLRKYAHIPKQSYQTIFLQMNESISNAEVEKLVNNKSNKVPEYIQIMNMDMFKHFCNQRTALTVI